MKPLLLALIAATFSAPVAAEWVKISEAEDESFVLYIDPTRIRKDGNFRKVWEIQDLKQRHKDGEMSRRALIEYGCKEERYRILSASAHSEPMAGGKTFWSQDGVGMWSAIPPDTMAEDALKFVCAK